MIESAPSGGRSTGEGDLRTRRLIGGIATSLGMRAISMLVPLVLVPLTLGSLGVERYAVWMTALSLTAMLVFSDLGLGQGLMTGLAPLLEDDRHEQARSLVSAAYSILSVVVLAIGLVFTAVWSAIPWASLFNIRDTAAGVDGARIILVCAWMFLINIPLALVMRVQYATMALAQANLWQAGAGPLSLSLAGLAVVTDAGPVLVVLGASLGPPLMNCIASAWVYSRKLRFLRPTLSRPGQLEVRLLTRVGGGFLILSVVMAVATALDNPLIAVTLSASAVTTFAIVARAFLLVGSFVSLTTTPLWPASAQAMASGDSVWVRRTCVRMSAVSILVAVLLSGALVLGGEPLFQLWTGEDISVSRWLLTGWAAWWVMLAALSPFFMVQNSVGVIRHQLVGWIAYMLASIPLKILVLNRYGVDALPWIAVVLYSVTVLPGCVRGYRSAMREGTPHAA